MKEQDNNKNFVEGKIKEPEAFITYFGMGLSRSLRKLHKHYFSSSPEKSPSIDTLKSWSRKFNWQERIDRLDKDLHRRLLKIAMKKVAKSKIDLVNACINVIEKFNQEIKENQFQPRMIDVEKAYKIIEKEMGRELDQYGGKNKINLTEVFQEIFRQEREKKQGKSENQDVDEEILEKKMEI